MHHGVNRRGRGSTAEGGGQDALRLEGNEFVSGVEHRAELLRGEDREEVCKDTSSVRRSHRSTGQGRSGGPAALVG